MAKYEWHRGFYYYLYHNRLQMVNRYYTSDGWGTGKYYTSSYYMGRREGTWHYFDLVDLDNPETIKDGFLYLTERNDEYAKELFMKYFESQRNFYESKKNWLNNIIVKESKQCVT